MQARKYIRFDSTQELHTRLMSAERCDYRIIARARAPDRSSMRALARGAWPHHNASGCACDPSGRPARTREGSPALPIFSGRLRGSIRLERTHVFVPAERFQAHQTVRRAMRSPSAGVSNRNDALARRNRIFLHRCHHIFVVETLRTRASPPESRRESSDSGVLIRLAVRRRAASSAPRSLLADWLCRRSTSSPDPRTSPTSRASFSPAPPCRDWPR